MKNELTPHAALQRGITFLEKQQRRDGGYDAITYSLVTMSGKGELSPTPFVTVCIMQAVGRLLSTSCQERALGYILSERGTRGTYNYWERKSIRFQSEPYPDDLDDTACALSARLILGEMLAGRDLGLFAKFLIACEQRPGGPYRTWLVGAGAPAAWRDIDPIVNANIAFVLKQLGTETAELTAYLHSVRGEQSPYYLPRTYLTYCLQRAGIDVTPKPVVDGTILEDALFLVTYLRRGGESKKVASWIHQIMRAQLPDGAWGNCPFITGDGNHWTGSQTYVTAICCEALHLLAPDQTRYSLKTKELEELGMIKTALHTTIKTWPVPIRSEAKLRADSFLQSGDGKLIALLPGTFNLHLPQRDQQPSKAIVSFAQATVAGWIAYTLLDDVYDGDAPSTNIPLAQLFLQMVHSVYYTKVPIWFQGYYERVMNDLNAAYAWEIQFARDHARTDLPEWKAGEQLAVRSFGHALGPLACLCMAGYNEESSGFKATTIWFHHYLIARQLTDDMHDWRGDLAHDILTFVTTALVRAWRLKQKVPIREADSSILSLFFWQEVAPDIANLILDHCAKARQTMQDPVLIQQNSLEMELSRLELSTEKALRERKMIIEFTQEF